MNTTAIRKLDTSHIKTNSDHIRLTQNKLLLPPSNEQDLNLESTPHFNLQLFDDSDEFQSDDNINEIHKERRETISSKQTEDNDDDDDDNNILHNSRSKSQSLDNISTKSSVIMRKSINPTRDVLTRRHALDPGAIHNLRSYVRHRKDSIVQRVIGYNYDDHSTAGGLYIRVGIGSKNEKY